MDHLGIEVVQILDWDGILHHNNAVSGESFHRDLQVGLIQALVLDLLGGRRDSRRRSGDLCYRHPEFLCEHHKVWEVGPLQNS